MCGVITTDPLQSLEADNSKSNCFPQNKSYFKYEDLPIPTLSPFPLSPFHSHEVLNSFPLNEVPGSDGLPVEFYITFWAAVRNLRVKFFNESFEKRELSSSQKQAVVTLIEKKGSRLLRS